MIKIPSPVTDPYARIAILYDRLFPIPEEQTKQELASLQVLLTEHGILLAESTILDIGGGTGRHAFPLSLLAKKVILAEPSLSMLQIAKSKQASLPHGALEYRQEGFEDLSVPDNSIDVLISFNDPFQYFLRHDSQLFALEKVFRSLKSGGFVLLELMNFFYLLKRYRYPEPTFWETATHRYSRFIVHEILAFEEIWKHIEHIYVEEIETGSIEHIVSEHSLKLLSPSELFLLFERIGFKHIKRYPGANLSAIDGTRLWVTAQKP